MATHHSLLAWRIQQTERGAWRTTVHGVEKSRTQLSDQHSTHRKHSKENEGSWALKLELNKVSQPLSLPKPSFLFRKGDNWTSTPRFAGIFRSKGRCVKSTKSFLQHFMCGTGNGLNTPACKPGAWSLLNCIHSDGSDLQLDCTVCKWHIF